MALYIPGYQKNAVIQLIFFCGVAYLLLALSWSVIMIIDSADGVFRTYFIPNIALGNVAALKAHWWTFLTYGWFLTPNSFFELLSNMLWLYCFGAVVQGLVGYRQVIPLFAYSLAFAGLVYMGLRLAVPALQAPDMVMGPGAGLMGMAVASVTLTPKYRFYLTETFTIPLMLVAGIFAGLQIISSGFSLPVLALSVSGGLMGFLYVRLLKAGYRPGDWIYNLFQSLENSVTPKSQRSVAVKRGVPFSSYAAKDGESLSQRRIDEILDKINQKGYNSLTKEEKELLLRAGKDK